MKSMITKKELQETQNDYRKFADYLLTRLEESQKRYLVAEGLLFDLLPWYGRIFAKKKIVRVLRRHFLFEDSCSEIEEKPLATSNKSLYRGYNPLDEEQKRPRNPTPKPPKKEY